MAVGSGTGGGAGDDAPATTRGGAFFEDPLTWSLLGLIGVVALVPKKTGRPVPNGVVPLADVEPTAPAS